MEVVRTFALSLLAITLALTGCAKRQDVVVVYTALDRNFSEPIFRRFEEQTGIRVLPKYDTESTKTVGLVNAIIAESDHPRCDVFWNNEIVNTIRLKQRGLLQPCRPANAQHYPPAFRDSDGLWYGFAARSRVIIANTELLAEPEIPRSLEDLASPALRGKTGIAKPLFGTTATHVACLFSGLGAPRAQELLKALKDNDVSVQSGNKACAVAVAQGQLAAAFTDTDDAVIEVRQGAPVALVVADAGSRGSGALLIPNTLSLVRDCPHPEAGRALIDYLLSPEVENRLAESASAQIPLNRNYRGPHPLGDLPERWMQVDFEAAAGVFEAAAQWVREEFLGP